MKNKYIQPKSDSGCVLYCMSNLFDHQFTDQSNYKKDGLNQTQQNTILSKVLNTIELRYLAHINHNITCINPKDLPKIIYHFVENDLLDSDHFISIQLTVGIGALHAINLYVDKSHIWVSDPLIEEIIEINTGIKYLPEFIRFNYNGLYSVSAYCLITKDLEEELIFFKKSDFKHLFD